MSFISPNRNLISLLISGIILMSGAINAQRYYNQKIIDSLEYRLRTLSVNDTTRVDVLALLSKNYLYKDARQSVEYGKQALELCQQLEKEPCIKIYLILARAYDRIPDNDNAMSMFKKAIELSEAKKDFEMLSWTYSALGFHYYNARNFPTAISTYETSLSYALEANSKKGIPEAYYGLGLVYTLIPEWEKQMDVLKQFFSYADSSTDQRMMADAYRMISENYMDNQRYDESQEANQRMYEIAASLKDSSLMGVAVNRIAWVYYLMGNLDKSLEFFYKNMEFVLPAGKAQTMANVYGNMGNIYRDWGRYPEALDYYKKSAVISQEVGDIYNLSWLYEDISILYARMGDYKQAYENQQLHSIFSDSLSSVTYQQRLTSARVQYEADKNARELELLSLRLQRNQYLSFALAGGIVLLIALGVLLILQYRSKSRQRIDAMNHKISELTQVNLRSQMNPHFIFNTLNSIQYYVFQNDKIASNNYMTKFASLIRKTLENSRYTAIPIKEELDALELYLELEALRFKEKFEWNVDIDEEIDTLSFKIPTMLIQPYVENAITHGLMNKEGKGYVKVAMKLYDKSILCTIEDNGVGRSKAMEIKQLKNNNHKSLGTTITESRLKLVNQLYGKTMKVHYTDLIDESGEPAGTRVEINIPIIT